MTASADALGIDVVGDVHGQHDALLALGRRLGYRVDGDWSHPDGRALVFLGDLVDRGPESLGVAELVMDLVARRRAICLMGNHEYNLVAYSQGLTGPKRSNRPTIADMEARPERWAPVLGFFADLPVAIELPGLRLVHAVWHLEHLARVRPVLGCGATEAEATAAGASAAGPPRRNGRRRRTPCADPVAALESSILLRSPFTRSDDGPQLHPELPTEQVAPGNDTPFEILLKGFEEPSEEPFIDADGKPRYLVRVAWWRSPGPYIPEDGRLVFGHYWNVPPTPGRDRETVPPHPSGHPDLRRWTASHAPQVPPEGDVPLDPDTRFVCVDYNGVARVGAGACVGAYRHPEHAIVWVRRSG